MSKAVSRGGTGGLAAGGAAEQDMTNLDVVERFETYEDYLDSQLTANDMAYLEEEDMARQLVELGYRGLGDTIRREVWQILEYLL